jgi:hypothetical protein
LGGPVSMSVLRILGTILFWVLGFLLPSTPGSMSVIGIPNPLDQLDF